MEQQKRTLGYILLIALLIAVDQIVKGFVATRMDLFQSIELWQFIKLTYIHNTGAAFGILNGSRILFVLFTAALLVLVALVWRKAWMKRYYCAVSLILGGALGNCIDRIFRGYVVDMFDLQFMDYPIFNLADIFVVVGVILGAVYYLWFYDKYDKRSGKEPGDDTAADSHK